MNNTLPVSVAVTLSTVLATRTVAYFTFRPLVWIKDGKNSNQSMFPLVKTGAAFLKPTSLIQF